MRYPHFIEFELTNHCQLKCIMCPHPQMTRPKGFMQPALVKKIVDEVRGHTKDSYLHIQGEPLLHPEFDECVNYVADAGIRTSFASNALLLDGDIASKVLHSKLNEIIISIDSLDKDTYEKIRVGSSFDKVYSNTIQFIKDKHSMGSKLEIVVCLTKMKENERDWAKFREGFAGATHVWTKGYSTFAGYATKGEVVARKINSCNKQQTHMSVLWNGDVVVCCRDFDGFSKYGNLYDDSVANIWARREQDCHKIPFCKDC